MYQYALMLKLNIKLYHIVIFMLNLTIALTVSLKLSKNKETFLLILKLICGSRGMASILQNLFVRALNPESVRSLKIVISHASLYLGIILYTAVGAKVMVVVIDCSGNWTVLIWMVISGDLCSSLENSFEF